MFEQIITPVTHDLGACQVRRNWTMVPEWMPVRTRISIWRANYVAGRRGICQQASSVVEFRQFPPSPTQRAIHEQHPNASSGIGKALALGWAKQGAKLILSGRDRRRLDDVAAAVGAAGGGETLILPFEMTDAAAMAAAVKAALKWTGSVDVLVNNAGISQRSQALNTSMQVYRDIIEIDLMAPIALSQAILPQMALRGSGKLVFISSIAGKVGVPLRTAYCAAKHGLIGYADALRAELSTKGVDVHVIAPGSVATNVSRNALDATGARRGVSDAAIDNGIPADEAAAEILSGIAAGTREIIVARGIELAMGEMRRTPDQLFDQIADMVAKGYIEKMEPQES